MEERKEHQIEKDYRLLRERRIRNQRREVSSFSRRLEEGFMAVQSRY